MKTVIAASLEIMTKGSVEGENSAIFKGGQKLCEDPNEAVRNL